ncbi:MAG: glycosyltransferase family 39 protein [Phycisphaerae bacterium]
MAESLEQQSESWPRPRSAIIFVLLTLYAAGLLRGVDQPWVGMQDWNGAYFSYISRNLLRYPIETSRLLPVVEMGSIPVTDAEVQRYATHPPGLPWLLAVSFALLGVSEWAARLVPILCSLGSLWLLIRITSSTLGRPVAIVAGLLYAVMPMSTFFGRMVNHEAVVLFFVLLAWWGWFGRLGIVETGRGRAFNTGLWIAGTVGAIWVDWPGCLAAAAVFVHALWLRRCGRCSTSTVICAALVPAVVVTAAVLWLVYGGLDGSWTAFGDMAFSRTETSAGDLASQRDRSMQGGGRQLTRDNFSPRMLGLAVAGLVIAVVQAVRRRPVQAGASHPTTAFLWMIGGVGGVWLALFWNQFLRHNYWQFYLGPAVVLLAAIAIVCLNDAVSKRSSRLANGSSGMILVFTVLAALLGTNDYFQRRSFSLDLIRGMQGVTDQLAPDERVLLFDPFIDHDRRGAYAYRNFVPPHLPYYLDRRAARAATWDDVQRLGGDASVLLFREDRMRPGGAGDRLLRRLAAQFPAYMTHGYLVVDLKPQLGRRYGEPLVGPSSGV